jgi:transcription elongation factor Elf1
MPWIALDNRGRKLAPEQASKDGAYTCPECGDSMTVVRRGVDGTARHFRHPSETLTDNGTAGGCVSVSESDVHLKWKSLAASRLATEFEGRTYLTEMEHQLSAPNSTKTRRIADAAVVFNDLDPVLGRGVVAEVQHRNESKDIEAATVDFLESGFAVVWLDKHDFSNNHCRLNGADFRQRARMTAWPEHVPAQQEWEDDHGVIHWLRSSKPTGLSESEVRIPHYPTRMDERWNLRDAWVEGRTVPIYADGNATIVRFQCVNCNDEELKIEIPQSTERGPKDDYRGHIILHPAEAGAAECSSCGVTNTIYKQDGYPDLKFKAKRGTVQARPPNESVLGKISCLNCDAFVEYIFTVFDRSDRRSMSSRIRFPDIYCPHCETSFQAKRSEAMFGLFD